MPVYVAMLRAVNVGGRRSVAMTDVRTAAEACGFTAVQTYVQSGNVVFAATDRSAARVADSLQRSIMSHTTLDTGVVIRTAAQMQSVVERNPYSERAADAPPVHVVFTSDAVGAIPVAADRFPPDEYVADGREIYLWAPNGVGRSKLAAALGRAVPDGTMRNWRTVTTLTAMASPTP